MSIRCFTMKIIKLILLIPAIVAVMIFMWCVVMTEGDLFIKKDDQENRAKKFRFEDLGDDDEQREYFKKRYPAGSDGMKVILEVTAAGAYCYEDHEKDLRDVEGIRHYHCKYYSALFSKDVAASNFLMVSILNEKVQGLNIHKTSRFII